MKKRFILIIILSLLFVPYIVKASSATVQIDAPSIVYVGDTVKVNVTISSSDSIGSWQYTVGYDDSKLSLSSWTSETAGKVTNWVTSSGKTSVSYSWTFKATSAGAASFNVSSIAIYAFDETQMSVGGSTSKTITIKTPAPVNNNGNSGNNAGNGNNGNNTGNGNNNTPAYNYSNNNYLSSLNIEGFDLKFDKSITDYSISVPNDTKKVNIGATAEDGKAKVSGIGEFEVKEGSNSISITVKAENGDVRTYNINVDVLELSPIEVNIDNDKFYVIRKQEMLPIASMSFSPNKVLIKGEEVPCYYSETADLYLVGLKDETSNISLYRYDNAKDKFYDYKELSFGSIYLYIMEPDTIIKGFNPETVTINDKNISIYKKDGSYPLLYGMNLENGKISYYSYDDVENTVQRFIVSNSNTNNGYYSYVVIGLIGVVILQFVIMIGIIISKNKKLRKILNDKLSVKTNYEKELDFNADETEDNDNIENSDEHPDNNEMYRL